MITDPTDTSWWPDFSNRRIVILGAGPSLTQTDCYAVYNAGFTVIAINESWRLAPQAEYHYVCDWQYAKTKLPRPEAYNGFRMIGTWPPNVPSEMAWIEKHLALHRLQVSPGRNQLSWDDHTIGAGGNSCFQMLNFALRCGAKEIIFLGLDCHTPGMHWHGSHDHIEKPVQREHTLERWKVAFGNAARDTRIPASTQIYNCSPGTALTAFPAVPLKSLMEEAA